MLLVMYIDFYRDEKYGIDCPISPSIIGLVSIFVFLQTMMGLRTEERIQITLLIGICVQKNSGHIEQMLQIKAFLFGYFCSRMMLDYFNLKFFFRGLLSKCAVTIKIYFPYFGP